MSVGLTVLAFLVALAAPWLSPLAAWKDLSIDAAVLFCAAFCAAMVDL